MADATWDRFLELVFLWSKGLRPASGVSCELRGQQRDEKKARLEADYPAVSKSRYLPCASACKHATLSRTPMCLQARVENEMRRLVCAAASRSLCCDVCAQHRGISWVLRLAALVCAAPWQFLYSNLWRVAPPTWSHVRVLS